MGGLLILVLLIPAIVGIISALVFILLLRTGHLGLAQAYLLFLLVLSVPVAVNLTFGIGAGIFGRILSCLTFPAIATSLMVLIAGRAASFRSFGEDRLRRRWYLVGLVLIPLLHLAPVLGEYAIVQTCNAVNRRAGNTIVEALEAFQQAHSAYPQELEALVPSYVPELPWPRCFAPFRWFRRSDRSQTWFSFGGAEEFGLRECSREGVTVLTVPSVEFDFILRCNVTTGHWSRVSAFDGACAYVR